MQFWLQRLSGPPWVAPAFAQNRWLDSSRHGLTDGLPMAVCSGLGRRNAPVGLQQPAMIDSPNPLGRGNFDPVLGPVWRSSVQQHDLAQPLIVSARALPQPSQDGRLDASLGQPLEAVDADY